MCNARHNAAFSFQHGNRSFEQIDEVNRLSQLRVRKIDRGSLNGILPIMPLLQRRKRGGKVGALQFRGVGRKRVPKLNDFGARVLAKVRVALQNGGHAGEKMLRVDSGFRKLFSRGDSSA